MKSKPLDDERKTESAERETRFRIEKLEERIAPAKGGIPGKPGGLNYYGGYCHLHGKHRWCEP